VGTPTARKRQGERGTEDESFRKGHRSVRRKIVNNVKLRWGGDNRAEGEEKKKNPKTKEKVRIAAVPAKTPDPTTRSERSLGL